MRAAAALVSLFLLTACGGDDGAARAEYISQAEVICTNAEAEQKKLGAPSVATIAPYVAKIVAIVDRVVQDLTALDEPEADAKELEAKVFKPLREQLALAKAYSADLTTAVKKNDQAAVLKLAGNPPTETKADLRWMKSYGFNSCVKAADTSD